MALDKRNGHSSTHIDMPGWGMAEIDAEFVQVITKLNKVGLKTRQCCQGDGGQYSYITFELKGLTLDKKLDDDPNGTITLRWELH